MANLSDKNKNLTFVPSPQSPDSAGFVKESADDTVPSGFLECNGQAVSRTTYSELFDLIGTTYGVGDGSTTFNLPGGTLTNNLINTGDLTVSDTQATMLVESTSGNAAISQHKAGSFSFQSGYLNSGSGRSFLVGENDATDAQIAIGFGTVTSGIPATPTMTVKYNTASTAANTSQVDLKAGNSTGVGEVLRVIRQGGTSDSVALRYNGGTGHGSVVFSNGAGSNIVEIGSDVVAGTGAGITSTSGSNSQIQFGTNNIKAGHIDISQDWYRTDNNSTWSTTSDERVKDNIRPVADCLDKVTALIPRHFNYVDTPDVLKTGFIAQEVETILPGHVLHMEVPEKYDGLIPEGEDLKGLSPEFLPYLVGAIKELKDKNDALEARIVTLEGV